METRFSQATDDSSWPDDAALTHYLAGESDSREAEIVEAWVAANPENLGRLNKLRTAWEFAAQPIVHGDPEYFVANFRHGLSEMGVARQGSFSRGTVRRWAKGAAALTAARIGILSFAVLALVTGVQYLPELTKRPAAENQTYTTTTGQRARITLNDGSTVTLAPNSRIFYASEFGNTGRELQLEGEAMFVVAHNNGAPFIVNTGNVKTRVLGTTFTVSKYPADSDVRVVIAEGKVAVNDKIASTGDVALAGSDGVKIEHSGDVTNYLAWVNGDIYWKSASSMEVIETIERWYGIKVMIPARNTSSHFTATFHNPTVNELLSYLSGVLGASYERRGNQVIFQ